MVGANTGSNTKRFFSNTDAARCILALITLLRQSFQLFHFLYVRNTVRDLIFL